MRAELAKGNTIITHRITNRFIARAGVEWPAEPQKRTVAFNYLFTVTVHKEQDCTLPESKLTTQSYLL